MILAGAAVGERSNRTEVGYETSFTKDYLTRDFVPAAAAARHEDGRLLTTVALLQIPSAPVKHFVCLCVVALRLFGAATTATALFVDSNTLDSSLSSSRFVPLHQKPNQ